MGYLLNLYNTPCSALVKSGLARWLFRDVPSNLTEQSKTTTIFSRMVYSMEWNVPGVVIS